MHPADLGAVALLAPAAALLLAVLVGWGRLLRRLLRDDDGGDGSWTADTWAGWAAGTVFLQLWHLALPIDWRAAAATGLVGAAGWWWRRRARTGPAGTAGLSRGIATAAGCLVLFVLIVRHVRSDLPVYDAGMYYYQAIRWLTEHPIVPGLGNLNLQLGINQTYFLWAALLNLHPVWSGGFLVVNCLMLVVAMAPGVRELVRLRRRDPPPGPLAFLRILSLPVLTAFAMNDGSANPAPDMLSWVFCIVVFERAAAWLLAARAASGPPPRPPFLLVLLCAVLVTVKLSMIVYAAALLAVTAVVFVVRTRGRAGGPGLLRPAAVAAAIGLAGGLPWVARNIVYTGYPLFPSPAAACPVEWRVPQHKIRFVAELIRSSARFPGRDSRDFRRDLRIEEEKILLTEPGAMSPDAFRDLVRSRPWFGSWLADTVRSPLGIATLGGPVALILLMAGVRRLRRGRDDPARPMDPLYVPLLAAVAFWLHAAPALRFGLPFLSLLLLLPAAQICACLPPGPALRRGAGALVLVLALVPLADGFPRRSSLWRSTVVPPSPRAEFQDFTTLSGLVVHSPIRDARSFDNPIPSTHLRNPHLSLLDPARGIAGGFKDDAPPPPDGL